MIKLILLIKGIFIYDFQVAPEMRNCGLETILGLPHLLGCKVCSVFFIKKKEIAMPFVVVNFMVYLSN